MLEYGKYVVLNKYSDLATYITFSTVRFENSVWSSLESIITFLQEFLKKKFSKIKVIVTIWRAHFSTISSIMNH